MKISAISKNQNFKGLFTNKTKDDNWLMEYRPYSWENPYNTSVHKPYYDVKKTIMYPKEKIDIFASKLPCNEEIFTPMTKTTPAESKDIFGTVSFYEYPTEVNLGEFRDRITEAQPYNLEESLKIYLKKNEIFRQMKLEELLKTKKTIEDSIVNMKTGIQKCDSTARESEGFNFFGDAVSRRNDAFFDLEHIIFRKHRELIEKYIKIVESIEELDKLLNHIKQELKLISEKKQAGDIIDISIRHDFDPNKALYDEGLKLAQNQKLIQSSPKLVLLSYRTVLLKDMANEWIKQSTQILKNINKEYIAKNLAEGLTRIADAMISFRL